MKNLIRVAIIPSKVDPYNFIGICRGFWSPAFVDELVDSVISWRSVNVKYGRREVANLSTQHKYNSRIVGGIKAFNKATYRVPDLQNNTITSAVYRYSDPEHKYDWHQDIIYNLQILKNWERIRRYSAVVMLSNPEDYVGGDLEIQGFNEPILLNKGDLVIYTAIHAHRVTPLIEGARMTYCAWLESRHYAHTLEVQ
jgi:predicted 2-oxoglutarate/Fe(II)-dependent dioxygenase YbiX